MNRSSFRSSFRKKPSRTTISHIISKPQSQGNQTLTKHSYLVNSNASIQKQNFSDRERAESPIQHQRVNFDADALIDSFIEKAARLPLHQCVEEFLREKFNTKTAVYWQEIPNAQILYSQSLKLVNEHSVGIVGNCYFQRTVMRVQAASAHPSYSSQIDGRIAGANQALLLFPLVDWRNTLTAVCEVGSESGEFTIEDELFAKWFYRKFKAGEDFFSQL